MNNNYLIVVYNTFFRDPELVATFPEDLNTLDQSKILSIIFCKDFKELINIINRIKEIYNGRLTAIWDLKKAPLIFQGKFDYDSVIKSIDSYFEKDSIKKYSILIYENLLPEVINIIDYNNIKILAKFSNAAKLIKGWKNLITIYEGYSYCVYNNTNNQILISGTFDPDDIISLKENIVFDLKEMDEKYADYLINS